MQYTVWKIYRDDNPESVDIAREVTAPDAKPNALAAAVTLNAAAPEGVRYEALPLGGSPFDVVETPHEAAVRRNTMNIFGVA